MQIAFSHNCMQSSGMNFPRLSGSPIRTQDAHSDCDGTASAASDTVDGVSCKCCGRPPAGMLLLAGLKLAYGDVEVTIVGAGAGTIWGWTRWNCGAGRAGAGVAVGAGADVAVGAGGGGAGVALGADAPRSAKMNPCSRGTNCFGLTFFEKCRPGCSSCGASGGGRPPPGSGGGRPSRQSTWGEDEC